MVLIYQLGIALYAMGIRIASLWNAKARLFVAGRQGLLLRIRSSLENEKRPRIWMHCASLGEFEQGRPVLEKLKKQHPGYAIVLSFFSPSGYEVCKNYDGADYVFYLPIDTKRNAPAFINAVNPKLAIFVKYELWYNYLSQLAKTGVPTILISAIFRPGQLFFAFFEGLKRRMLGFFTQIFVQDAKSQALLQQTGIASIVAGDTRFDRVLEIASKSEPMPDVDAFCKDSKIIVAGSTWPSDERHLQYVLRRLPSSWKLIIAPHEVHEEHIEDIMRLFGQDAVKLSAQAIGSNARVLVVDSIGKLSHLYRYANIAWIGGGFDEKGVHNVLEAAVYGKLCLYGPVYQKYREAIGLMNSGGAIPVHDADEAITVINLWDTDDENTEKFADKAARLYVEANAGATDRILNYIIEKNFLSTP